MLKNFSFILLLGIMASCTFNREVEDTGEAFLQGKWQEDSVKNAAEMMSYEKYRFRFVCDSFYLEIENYSKINLQGGECYDQQKWMEYAKGTYAVKGDTLELDGAYVSESYRFKPEKSCYRFGKMEDRFFIQKLEKDSITLTHQLTNMLHILQLKEAGTCLAGQQQ